MTAPARRLRPWAPRLGAALLVSLLVVAAGCGSGSGDPTTTTDAAVPPRTGNEGAGRAAAANPAANAERELKSQGGDSRQPASAGDRQDVEKAPARPAQGKAGPNAQSQPPAGKKKVSKACPSGISRSECETLVAGYQQTKDKPSHAVQEPEDCLKAMGRSECEGLLEAQQESAEEAGSSVDVQQCLRKPTPRCEEILRAAFEAQVTAGATGK